MDIAIVILLAICTVAAFFVTVGRVVPMRRLFKHANIVDVVFTGIALVLFHGTLGGTLVAVFAGLVVSVVLSLGRKVMAMGAYDTARIKCLPLFKRAGVQDEFNSKGEWVYNTAPYV